MRITLVFLSLGWSVVSAASGPVDVALTAVVRKYCHIVQFPQGWKTERDDPRAHQPLFYGYDSLYEFRIPAGLETTFLVGGIELPSKRYTINKYKVDLSDPVGIAQPASEKEWGGGTKLPDARRSDWTTFANVHLTNLQPLEFHGFQFVKSGNFWPGEYARLSPARRWLVLLSSSGRVANRNGFLISGGRDRGTLFMDAFDADTGKKIVTVVGTYLDIHPGHALNQTTWVTDQYFIVPLGEHRERCLVCEFK